MPQVSTGPLVNKVTPIVASYVFAADDTYASIQEDAVFPSNALGGLIISLPGPQEVVANGGGGGVPTGVTDPNADLPSNGDFYKVADPTGQIGTNSLLTVWGGGYDLYDPIAGIGRKYLRAGAGNAFSEFTFTFDDEAGVWIVCAGGPLG